MSSKGSKIVTFRIPPELELDLITAIERGNQFRAKEPWTQTTFILSAIKEKLSHLDRSSKRKKGKQTPSANGQKEKDNAL